MATAVCQREQVDAWSSIFPAQQSTEQQSVFFVKKLLAVSVSYLTYLRNIFPENAYANRYLDDLNLKILQVSIWRFQMVADRKYKCFVNFLGMFHLSLYLMENVIYDLIMFFDTFSTNYNYYNNYNNYNNYNYYTNLKALTPFISGKQNV